MTQVLKNILTHILLFILICTHLSCNKSLLSEIPAYLEINEFHYDNTNEKYNQSTKITDAWVTMDGQFLGAFELPCKIPILCDNNESETHSFDIYPGIKINGIAATRDKYPFYEKFQIDVSIERNNIMQISPVTVYTSNTEFFYQNEAKFPKNRYLQPKGAKFK